METSKPEKNTTTNTQQRDSSHNFTHYYHIGLIITGLIYLCGYLINQIYLRNLGIESPSLFRTQYIETGLVFVFLVFVTIYLPYFAITITYKSISKLNYNNFNSVVVFLLTFLVRLAFIAIFFLIVLFTDADWSTECKIPIIATIRTIFAYYFPTFIILSFILGKIELLKVPSDFSEKEFILPYSIERLCANIEMTTGIGVYNYTIQTFNKILTVPNFYDTLCEKNPNQNFSKEVRNLISKTDQCRAEWNKKKDFLSDKEKSNIKELNRLLLEETFGDHTPKIREREQIDTPFGSILRVFLNYRCIDCFVQGLINHLLQYKRIYLYSGRGINFIFTMGFSLILMWKIKWIGTLWQTMRYYILVSILFCLIVWIISSIFNRFVIRENKNLVRNNVLIYCLLFIFPVFYILITNYANRVYTILPTNRGGRLPLTQAHITLKDTAAKELWASIKEETEFGKRLPVIRLYNNSIYPLYIIEQNDTCLYVATDYPAFYGYSDFERFPAIHKINKEDIVIIDYENFNVKNYHLKYIDKKEKRKKWEKERASLDFQEEDFISLESIEKLYKNINNDLCVPALNNSGSTIDRLNGIITIPNLYDIYLFFYKTSDIDISFSSNVKELLNKTEKYRIKLYSELQENEKRNIKELNHYFLEEMYPQLFP